MSVRTLTIPCLLTLASCYGASRFEAQYVEARCDWYTTCFPEVYTSMEGCEEQIAHQDDRSECEFDADAAHACVDAWRQLTCPESAEMPDFPLECDLVYACQVDDGDTDSGLGS